MAVCACMACFCYFPLAYLWRQRTQRQKKSRDMHKNTGNNRTLFKLITHARNARRQNRQNHSPSTATPTLARVTWRGATLPCSRLRTAYDAPERKPDRDATRREDGEEREEYRTANAPASASVSIVPQPLVSMRASKPIPKSEPRRSAPRVLWTRAAAARPEKDRWRGASERHAPLPRPQPVPHAPPPAEEATCARDPREPGLPEACAERRRARASCHDAQQQQQQL